jgi:hypothetical protein
MLKGIDSRCFWRELHLIKSDWLSLMILYNILHRVRKFEEISLRQFSTKILLVPPEKVTEVKNKKPEN